MIELKLADGPDQAEPVVVNLDHVIMMWWGGANTELLFVDGTRLLVTRTPRSIIAKHDRIFGKDES
jgi:hypothetical protein